MITSMEQAQAVQLRRVEAGLRGYAKAVRRYLKKTYPERYRMARGRLPVEFAKQPVDNEAAAA